MIADRVLGDGDHQAEVHWHLDPRWTVTAAGDGWLRADDGAGDPVWMRSLDGELEIVRGSETGGEPGLGWVAPAYGHVVPSTTLRLVRRGAAPFTLVTVLLEAADRPSIEALPVRVDGAVDPTAAGLRLVAGEVTDTVVFGSTTPRVDARSDMPGVRRRRRGRAAGERRRIAVVPHARIATAHTGRPRRRQRRADHRWPRARDAARAGRLQRDGRLVPQKDNGTAHQCFLVAQCTAPASAFDLLR